MHYIFILRDLNLDYSALNWCNVQEYGITLNHLFLILEALMSAVTSLKFVTFLILKDIIRITVMQFWHIINTHVTLITYIITYWIVLFLSVWSLSQVGKRKWNKCRRFVILAKGWCLQKFYIYNIYFW